MEDYVAQHPEDAIHISRLKELFAEQVICRFQSKTTIQTFSVERTYSWAAFTETSILLPLCKDWIFASIHTL